MDRNFIRMKQLTLIDEVCPRCMLSASEVGELHEDDLLCAKCEGEFVAEMAELRADYGID